MFITASDLLYRTAADSAPRPALTVNDVPAIGRFVRKSQGREKYATRYYEFAKEVSQLSAAVNNYKALGDIDSARELMMENIDSLRYKRFVNKVNSALSRIRKSERLIWTNGEMTSDEKRVKLDEIGKKKNEIYKKAYSVVYGK